MKTVIEMAREAGFSDAYLQTVQLHDFEAFAALVREEYAAVFSKDKPMPKFSNGKISFDEGLYTPLEIQLAVDLYNERETCAKMCEDIAKIDGHVANSCAFAIRARSNK